MEFGIEKCASLLMNNWKKETTEGIELKFGKNQKSWREEKTKSKGEY